MTFSLSYEIDYKRVISAVINDSRWTIPALQGANGMEIYAYIQSADFGIMANDQNNSGQHFGFVWRLLPDINFNECGKYL